MNKNEKPPARTQASSQAADSHAFHHSPPTVVEALPPQRGWGEPTSEPVDAPRLGNGAGDAHDPDPDLSRSGDPCRRTDRQKQHDCRVRWQYVYLRVHCHDKNTRHGHPCRSVSSFPHGMYISFIFIISHLYKNTIAAIFYILFILIGIIQTLGHYHIAMSKIIVRHKNSSDNSQNNQAVGY